MNSLFTEVYLLMYHLTCKLKLTQAKNHGPHCKLCHTSTTQKHEKDCVLYPHKALPRYFVTRVNMCSQDLFYLQNRMHLKMVRNLNHKVQASFIVVYVNLLRRGMLSCLSREFPNAKLQVFCHEWEDIRSHGMWVCRCVRITDILALIRSSEGRLSFANLLRALPQLNLLHPIGADLSLHYLMI